MTQPVSFPTSRCHCAVTAPGVPRSGADGQSLALAKHLEGFLRLLLSLVGLRLEPLDQAGGDHSATGVRGESGCDLRWIGVNVQDVEMGAEPARRCQGGCEDEGIDIGAGRGCQDGADHVWSSSEMSFAGRASRSICSKVHWSGRLSGRQRRNLAPWRKRSPVT